MKGSSGIHYSNYIYPFPKSVIFNYCKVQILLLSVDLHQGLELLLLSKSIRVLGTDDEVGLLKPPVIVLEAFK